jgi:hypothetical protein
MPGRRSNPHPKSLSLKGFLERDLIRADLPPQPPLRVGEGEQRSSQRLFKSPLHNGEGIRGEVNELTRYPLSERDFRVRVSKV